MSTTVFKEKSYGKHTSTIEVTNIDGLGFWILLDSKEYHLSFVDFPWFMNASIKQISHIQKESQTHLYWPDLDVDLALDMIQNPENYPLRSL
jgi:hypothetical protein